ncbi:MAG TPA: Ig-like domain repeat protein, partial [Isosphaeraceae bacterium]
AVDNLICDWVLPDQQAAFKQMLGLDTSGSMPAGPTTVTSGTPVNVPLGDCVHAGDTILIHATEDTTDPNEDGEGEPLVLKMSGGTKPDGTRVQGESFTINTYGQERDVTLVAPVDNETLSAYIIDADGDETGTVTAQDTANSSTDLNSSQDQNLADNSSQENIDASALASAADADGGASAAAVRAGSASPALAGPVNITFTTTASGTVASVAASATSAQAATAGYEVLAALEWRESTALNALTVPKPDSADGTVPTPQPHAFSLSAPGAAAKEVAAFNAYFANIGRVIGLADALNAALNKSAGAKAAGHVAAEIAQDTAARGYASQLSALLGQQATLRANLAAALKAAGVTQTVSTGDVQSFESKVSSSGLPAAITKVLQLTGADTATIAAIRTLATVQDPNAVAGALTDKLAGGALATSLPKAAAAVQSLASADLGVVLLPISDSLPPGTTLTSIALGYQITYSIIVTNASALSVSGAVLTDVFDPALSDVTWSSSSSGGAKAPAAGTGNILATLTLPPGASVSFDVSATVSARPAGGKLVDTASVALPVGLTDAHPADNTATSTLQVTGNPALKPLVIPAIVAQQATAGKALSVQARIVDPNFPPGQVTFSLDPGAPAGAKVDPKTGTFTWTPGAGQTTASVTIRATDYGDPTLSSTRSFAIHVNAASGGTAVTSAIVAPSLASPTYGQSLFFGAGVVPIAGLGTPTGTIQFVVDGATFGAPVPLMADGAISPSLATLGAGVHHVAAVYLGDATYAAVASPILTTTIARAPLLIVANSATKFYGQPNPPIFAAGFGFVLGQGLADLAGTLSVVTTATAASHVGFYPITAGGLASANYAITYVAGAMAVTPPPAGVSPADQGGMAFVTTLYEEILGRGPDPAGLAFWVQVLDRGVTPATVAVAFWNSPEHVFLVATNRAPRIALATALADAQAARAIAFGLAPRGPLSLAAWPGWL